MSTFSFSSMASRMASQSRIWVIDLLRLASRFAVTSWPSGGSGGGGIGKWRNFGWRTGVLLGVTGGGGCANLRAGDSKLDTDWTTSFILSASVESSLFFGWWPPAKVTFGWIQSKQKKLSHFRLQPDKNVFTPLNTAADFLLRLGLPMLLLVDVESLDLTPNRFLLKIEKDVPPIASDFLKK